MEQVNGDFAKICGKGSASECVEAQLFAFLRRLEPSTRRAILSGCFSQRQRLALERWIIAERSHGAALQMQRSRRVGCKRKREERPQRSHRSGICVNTLELIPDRPARGIHRRMKSGRVTYCACAQVGPFVLATRYFADVEQAHRRYDVILAVRRRFAQCKAPSMGVALRDALREEPRKFGFGDAEIMGLRVSVVTPAKYWVGTALKTPQYMASSKGLEMCLSAWQRLSEARGLVYKGCTNILRRHTTSELQEAWERLREVYVSIWTEAGFSKARVTTRLENLEARRNTRRQHLEANWSLEMRWLGTSVARPIQPRSAIDMPMSYKSASADSLPVSGKITVACAEAGQKASIFIGKGIECRIRRLLARWPCESTAIQLEKLPSQKSLKDLASCRQLCK